MVHTAKVDNAVQATRQLKDTTNLQCSSTQSVRCALKEAELNASPQAEEAATLKRYIKQRRRFALEHRRWTVEK